MSNENKTPIKVPIQMAFTDLGFSYFSNNKKYTSKLTLADSSNERGIVLNNFTADFIHQMISLEFISKIELSLAEFSSNSADIMNISKTIVYSKLFKQFGAVSLNNLISSECVKKYNRANPRKYFDENTVIDTNTFNTIAITHAKEKENIQNQILTHISKKIGNNSKYSSDEKKDLVLLAQNLLKKMPVYNWFLLLVFSGDPLFSELLIIMRKLIEEYIERSVMAEYTGLILLELAKNYETRNIKKEAAEYYGESIFDEKMLFDQAVRTQIINELQKKNKLIFLSWTLQKGKLLTSKTENTLKISLYNSNAKFTDVKESIDKKKSVDIRKKTLIDFSKENSEEQLLPDLGLYYLSYLDDVCKTLNIKFTSQVNLVEQTGLTVIELFFKF